MPISTSELKAETLVQRALVVSMANHGDKYLKHFDDRCQAKVQELAKAGDSELSAAVNSAYQSIRRELHIK